MSTQTSTKALDPANEGISRHPITSRLVADSAVFSTYLAEIIATKPAEIELQKFRTGNHDGTPIIFSEDSLESKELFEGAYYQELTKHLVDELGKWYKGRIPATGGLFLQGNSFRVFSPSDAIPEMINGIDLADIIGTFTYYVRATTKDGMIHFSGVNQLSLESYSGENYLRHGLVDNPKTGPLSSTTQIFEWRVAIPDELKEEINEN